MRTLGTLFLLALVPVCGCLAWAGPDVAGSWELVSDSPDGTQYNWTLVVTEEQGRFAGKLSGGPPPHEFSLLEPRVEGGKFAFRFEIQGEMYSVEAAVSGSSFDGTWRGGNSRGVIKGKRQSRSRS